MITFAKYKDEPLIMNAKTINEGITNKRVSDLFMNNSLIAGSSK